jgi:hypothetical protein
VELVVKDHLETAQRAVLVAVDVHKAHLVLVEQQIREQLVEQLVMEMLVQLQPFLIHQAAAVVLV